MTTATNSQEDARKIWEQLDAEESGQSVVDPALAANADDGGAATAAHDAGEQQTTDTTQGNEGGGEQTVDEHDPKVLLTKIAGLEAMVNQLTGRVRNAEGHIGGINSQLRQRLETARTVAASGGDAPSAQEIRAAQASPEAFAALEKEYPEFAKAMKPLQEAIDSRLAAIERSQATKTPAAAVAPAGDETSSQSANTDEQIKSLKVEVHHKGWEQTVKTAEFRGWFQNAPLEVRLLAQGDEPEQAIRLLDLYQESRKPRPEVQQKERRLETAAALPTGNRSSVKTKSVEEMTGEEFWRYLDQVDKQKA